MFELNFLSLVQGTEISNSDKFRKNVHNFHFIFSGSGKSSFIHDLIAYSGSKFTEPFKNVVYCLAPDTLELQRPFVNKLKATCEKLKIQLIVLEGVPQLTHLHNRVDLTKNTFLGTMHKKLKFAKNSVKTNTDLQRFHEIFLFMTLVLEDEWSLIKNSSSIDKLFSFYGRR